MQIEKYKAMKWIDFLKKSKRKSSASAKDRLMFNKPDAYIELTAGLEMVNGCAIIDAIVDGVDLIGDSAVDLVDDIVDDVADDVTDDAADDVSDDITDDVSQDVIEDIEVDVSADPAIPSSLKAEMKLYGILLGGAAMSAITHYASQAITNALNQGGGVPNTTSAQYWEQLYNSMVAQYPCDSSAKTTCPSGERTAQAAMIGCFLLELGNQQPTAAQTAADFEQSSAWLDSGENALKKTLAEMSQTTGIPSLVQYMETYTNPGASGAALVLATGSTALSPVVNAVYPDVNS